MPGKLIALLAVAASAGAFAAKPAVPEDPNAMRVLLAPVLETTLSSQMAGTLGTLNASLGQTVGKGATLVSLGCGEIQARASVAKAELNMARQNFVAKQGMHALNAAGDIEVANARTEVEKATGALALVNAQLGYCKVAAPFGGRIAKVYVKPYQTVAAGTPLFDLVSDGALKVRLNVPSTLLKKLKKGTALDVTIHETGKTYPAKVSAVNARVDAVAQTVELEARLNAAYPELVAGMSGVAQLANAQ
ncbi:efflux RND transporter periplasmic adaptor subunit [Jeongeupia naejangsanensis]|uniref:Efflux RND transporter periplasmic adaptor subunit n=1 Tax=Jeongeupia naejangsanensis TaxID=613195 RepID=A0ABS2BMK3_9NEIS|nr:efflux RND transporter periplasmic adaptor subunit [Jeongeupia naejangsanensis]MBM3116851.1 efflux RND transporter periplasmic adaptor subunit [Jeongeupia naejangsanensis]